MVEILLAVHFLGWATASVLTGAFMHKCTISAYAAGHAPPAAWIVFIGLTAVIGLLSAVAWPMTLISLAVVAFIGRR